MAEPAPLWIYAVLPGTAAAPTGVTGVAGEQIRLLPLAGLAAAVGRVQAELASEQALRRRLAEPAWLEAAVRRHHKVVADLFAMMPTVPFRIATVYHDERRARQALDGRAATLGSALERVTGRAEWGVRAYRAAPAAIAGPTTTDPATTDPATSEPAGTGPASTHGPGGAAATVSDHRPAGAGTTYLMRRRDALADRERARAAAAAEAEQLCGRLAGVSVAEHRSPVRAAPGPDEPGPALLNASFLVGTADADRFVATARELAAQLPHLRLRLAGPLPPYSFVDVA